MTTPQPVEDADARLIAALRAGDEAAFEELVRENGGRMLAVARRFLPREDDAQDAVQDAFLSAFRAFDRFDGKSRLSTWLHRIVVNAALMKLRTRRRKPERSIEDYLPAYRSDGHPTNPALIDWSESIPDTVHRMDVAAMVRAQIEELPETYRTVLLLRDIEGLDTQEAAEMLGITVNAVKTRLHRARQALREMLEQRLREVAA